MPDIAIKPATSIDDTTGVIKMTEYGRPSKLIPTYLVSLDGDKKGVEQYFIATKFDETQNCAKVIGFFSSATKEDIISKYEKIISETPITEFIEILFPWVKVKNIRSLVYRHKNK